MINKKYLRSMTDVVLEFKENKEPKDKLKNMPKVEATYCESSKKKNGKDVWFVKFCGAKTRKVIDPETSAVSYELEPEGQELLNDVNEAISNGDAELVFTKDFIQTLDTGM